MSLPLWAQPTRDEQRRAFEAERQMLLRMIADTRHVLYMHAEPLNATQLAGLASILKSVRP